MRTRAAIGIGVVLVALVLATPASAKGPSEGTIEGEGLDAPIVVGHGEGTPDGNALIERTGFFHAVFGQIPDPMLDEAPTAGLGPRYTLRWHLPGPDGSASEIVQLLHPYAAGGPLVFTRAGQAFYGTEETRGGWFRAPESLVTSLQSLGVPDEAALVAAGSGGSRWAPIGASLAAMLLLGIGLVAFSRSRAAVTPATT